jgi:hypothetical protein
MKTLDQKPSSIVTDENPVIKRCPSSWAQRGRWQNPIQEIRINGNSPKIPIAHEGNVAPDKDPAKDINERIGTLQKTVAEIIEADESTRDLTYTLQQNAYRPNYWGEQGADTEETQIEWISSQQEEITKAIAIACEQVEQIVKEVQNIQSEAWRKAESIQARYVMGGETEAPPTGCHYEATGLEGALKVLSEISAMIEEVRNPKHPDEI